MNILEAIFTLTLVLSMGESWFNSHHFFMVGEEEGWGQISYEIIFNRKYQQP